MTPGRSVQLLELMIYVVWFVIPLLTFWAFYLNTKNMIRFLVGRALGSRIKHEGQRAMYLYRWDEGKENVNVDK